MPLLAIVAVAAWTFANGADENAQRIAASVGTGTLSPKRAPQDEAFTTLFGTAQSTPQ